MIPTPPSARMNHLLATLTDADLRRWLPQLESVEMPLGQVLFEPGSVLSHAYFPTTAIVSLLYGLEHTASCECADVGHEGVIGLALVVGGGSAAGRAVVSSAGHGFRLRAQTMKGEVRRRGPLLDLMLRHALSLMTQMGRTAVCNRYHSLDQQLCRFLLMRADRLQSNELPMTQQSIASMLGVRREGVTKCALDLREAGSIRYSRGCIEVLDRKALEARACGCYAAFKGEYLRFRPANLTPDAAPS